MKAPTYDPLAGTHIQAAAKEAIKLAKQFKCSVPFKFNDVPLIATPKKSPHTIEWEYEQSSRRKADAYKASPKGKREAQARRDQIVGNRQIVASLVTRLPDFLNRGLDGAIEWVQCFTNPADDVEVKFDKQWVLALLETAGYKENEHVGQPKEWFNSKDRLGRYLMGQVINCLRQGMPPHPISTTFCEKYFALVQDP